GGDGTQYRYLKGARPGSSQAIHEGGDLSGLLARLFALLRIFSRQAAVEPFEFLAEKLQVVLSESAPNDEIAVIARAVDFDDIKSPSVDDGAGKPALVGAAE